VFAFVVANNRGMILYVLRHADAEERRDGLKDSDRRLTRRGHAQAKGAARVLASGEAPAETRPTRVLVSAAVRARETGAAVEKSLGVRAEVERRIGLEASDEDAMELVEELVGAGGVCVLVGHNPTLEDLIGALGGERELKKGQLVALDLRSARRGARGREVGRYRADV